MCVIFFGGFLYPEVWGGGGVVCPEMLVSKHQGVWLELLEYVDILGVKILSAFRES